MMRICAPRLLPYFVIALLALAAAMSHSVTAQSQIIHGQRPAFSQGLTFSSWDISGGDELTVQEWHVPLFIRAGVAENVDMAISGSLLNATGDWDLGDDHISGLTDSKIQVSGSLMDDQVLLSGGVSLPTGQTKLTDEQQRLLTWLSSDFLSFPVRSPGEGLNLFGQAGAALPAGQWVFGASIAGHLAGKYEPFDNGREYQPGSLLIFDFGTERIWPADHKLTADFIVIYSTDDKLEGRAIFRDGVQFDTRVHGILMLGKSSLEGGLRYILRGKDKQPGSDAELIPEPDKRHGDEFRLHTAVRIPAGQSVGLWASIDGKLLSANDYPKASPFFEDAARLTGFGGGLDFALGPRSSAGVGIRVWSGSSDGALGMGPLDLAGFELLQYFTMTF
jgi:hypothetical protein